METRLTVTIKSRQTTIELEEQAGTIEIYDNQIVKPGQEGLYLLYADRKLVEVSNQITPAELAQQKVEQVVLLKPTWELELAYIEQGLIEQAAANGIEVGASKRPSLRIPKNKVSLVEAYCERIRVVLETFGYYSSPLNKSQETKSKTGKAQHRWRKEISEIEFTTRFRGSQGTVIWQKRNQMVLKAGAKMMETAPLNKDGSVGFSAKMGEKIRSDNQADFKNFVTTVDLVLKSVNEVGLFLHFGGTNSWLELLDQTGQSIDEWTRVD